MRYHSCEDARYVRSEGVAVRFQPVPWCNMLTDQIQQYKDSRGNTVILRICIPFHGVHHSVLHFLAVIYLPFIICYQNNLKIGHHVFLILMHIITLQNVVYSNQHTQPYLVTNTSLPVVCYIPIVLR